jgi:DNA-binding Lrp family transcriptional regulator
MVETVFVLIKAKPTLIEPVLKALQAIPSVVEARAVTGAWDIVLRLERDYITDALAVVVKDIRAVEGIESTETLVGVNL